MMVTTQTGSWIIPQRYTFSEDSCLELIQCNGTLVLEVFLNLNIVL